MQVRLAKRRIDRVRGVGDAVKPREEPEILGGGELRVDEQVVREKPDASAQRRAAIARGLRPVTNAAG